MKKEISILQIASLVPIPQNDGGRVGIYHIVKQYLQRGVQIDYAAPRMNANDSETFSKSVTLHLLDIDTRYRWKGGLANLFSGIPYNIEKYHSELAISQLINIVSEKRFDAIQAESLHMAMYAIELKRKYHIPIILRQHNFQSEILRRYRDIVTNPLVKVYAHINYKKMLRYEATTVTEFDAVASVSDVDDAKLRSLAPNVHSVVIPAGVDCEQYYYQTPTFLPAVPFFN